MTGMETCALGDGQPIDRDEPQWLLCRGCLDDASALVDERTQRDGYHRGLDVRPTWPNDITFGSIL